MAPRILLISSIALLPLVGCAAPAADLVALPPPEGTAVPSTDSEVPKLHLIVKNQGKNPATSSPVVVEFFLRTLTVTSPPQDGGQLLAGEATKTLEFEIPQACVDSGCEFRIKVDPEKAVKESNESNNRVLGNLIGRTPAPKPVESTSSN